MTVKTWLVAACACALLSGFGVHADAHGQGMQVQPLPDNDPRARVAEAVMELLLRGDREAAAAHLRERGTPEYRTSERLEGELHAAMEAVARPGLAVVDYVAGRGDDVLVRLERDAPGSTAVFVAVTVEPEAPHRISRLGLPTIMMGPPAGAAAITRLEDGMRRLLIDALAETLEQVYVSADTGRAIADHVRTEAARGAFDEHVEPHAFAVALTAALRQTNGDLHLAVMSPELAQSRLRGAPDAERRANYYLPRVEVMDGNIGYLRVERLAGEPEAIARLGHALSFLQDADAIIIDLRGVGGGAGAMSEAIVNHFTAPGVPTLRTWSRLSGTSTTIATAEHVPGPRRTDVPLYILVDGRSGSAAEHVPFVLQNLGRATIVGERTAGAGRNNVMRPLPFGFVASISHSRVTDPASGRGWERSGVEPDLAVAAADALEAALEHARARVAR